MFKNLNFFFRVSIRNLFWVVWKQPEKKRIKSDKGNFTFILKIIRSNCGSGPSLYTSIVGHPPLPSLKWRASQAHSNQKEIPKVDTEPHSSRTKSLRDLVHVKVLEPATVTGLFSFTMKHTEQCIDLGEPDSFLIGRLYFYILWENYGV